MLTRLLSIFYFLSLLISTAGLSMEQEDLPLIELKGQQNIRLVYQSEAAFLQSDSPYEYLVTTNLWPCSGLVFSFNNTHLLIHKDDLTDLKSVKQLLLKKGLSEQDLSDIRLTIFSRKMKEEKYNMEGFLKMFNGLNQTKEIERTKNVLMSVLKLNPGNIRVYISEGYENSLVVGKDGQIFKAWQVNENFCPLDGLDIISKSQFCQPYEFDKRREVEKYFLDESTKLMKMAYDKNREMVKFGSAKPYLREYDAPADWPVIIKGHVCNIKNCHRLADSNCACCKKTYYCSQFCQKKDWPTHKVGCKAEGQPAK